MTRRAPDGRGRWIVISAQVVSRRRSKRAARAIAQLNMPLGVQFRRYRRRDAMWQDGLLVLRPERVR
jgi:hypothetical protein